MDTQTQEANKKYEAPDIEEVIALDELEQETLYAGGVGGSAVDGDDGDS